MKCVGWTEVSLAAAPFARAGSPKTRSLIMATPDNLYRAKNVLITGGAGFIASHVAILFAKKYPQYKIVVVDKLDYCANLNNLKVVAGLMNFKFVKGNICSADLIKYVLESEKIDTIIHAAAQVMGEECRVEPLDRALGEAV